MTTPNGDWKPVPYADHKRHYRGRDLEALLARHFSDVRIEYRVNAGMLFDFGYRAGSVFGMPAYGLSALPERFGAGGSGPDRKHHLLAFCTK